MQQSAGRELGAQPVEELRGELELLLRHRGEVPLGPFHVVDGDEGRLATDGEAHVAVGELAVHLPPEKVDRAPLRVGEGALDFTVEMCDGDRPQVTIDRKPRGLKLVEVPT